MTTPPKAGAPFTEELIREIVREEIAKQKVIDSLERIEKQLDSLLADMKASTDRVDRATRRDSRTDNDLAKAPRWLRKRAAGVPEPQEPEPVIEAVDRAIQGNGKLLDMVERNLERRAE